MRHIYGSGLQITRTRSCDLWIGLSMCGGQCLTKREASWHCRDYAYPSVLYLLLLVQFARFAHIV